MKQAKILSGTSSFVSDEGETVRQTFFLGSSYLFKKTFLDQVIKKIFKIQKSAIVIVQRQEENMFPALDLLIQRARNISTVEAVGVSNSYPPLYGVAIKYVEDDGNIRGAGGSSLVSTQEALLKCFGEYLERFNGYFSAENNSNLKIFPQKQYFNYKKSSLRISQLASPLSQQRISTRFPKHDSDLSTVLAAKAFNSTKNKIELLPLPCLYYNVGLEKFIHQTSTNGAGGGITLETARLAAIYELIERDHFLLYWLAGIAPPMIEVSSLPIEFKDYVLGIMDRYRLEVYLLNTSYDTDIFSCICVIVDPVLQRVALGGAAGTNTLHVLNKSLCEALAEIHSVDTAHKQNQINYQDYVPFSDESLDKDERRRFYNTEDGVKLFKLLFLKGAIIPYGTLQSVFSKSFQSPSTELSHIVDVFKRLTSLHGDGYNLYFFEYKGALLEEYDYIASKSFVPSLIKLWLHESLATPWSERLVQFAESKNKLIRSEQDINRYPHPFP